MNRKDQSFPLKFLLVQNDKHPCVSTPDKIYTLALLNKIIVLAQNCFDSKMSGRMKGGCVDRKNLWTHIILEHWEVTELDMS